MVEVSVIIPAYNAEQFIEETLQSVFDQKNVDLEVIVLDDGSTDRTWEILEEYGDSIQKYCLDHGGPYRARNFGVSLARGEWIAFLDADDVWEPEKLRTQLELADDETALVYTDCRNIGATERVKPLQSDSTEFFEGDVFPHLVMGNFISLSSVLVHRTWFDRLGGFSDNSIGVQDWDLWLRLAAEGGKVRLCPEPLTLYRHHANQMSSSLEDRLNDRLNVLESALSHPAGRDLSWKIKRRAYAGAWQISAWRAADGDSRLAVRYYLKSAFYWPFDSYVHKQIIKCCLKRLC